MIECFNPKCKKQFEPDQTVNEPDPSPDYHYCSNTCYRVGQNIAKYKKDKRKSLHVKPDTYELFLQAKKKLNNTTNLQSVGENDNDDRILFSIITYYLLESV